MKNVGIIELRQTGENDWKARYQGNYGIYTIRITVKGRKTVDYSCTCPSRYYPCKHIHMIEDAIAEKMATQEKQEKCGLPELKNFIQNVPPEKLRDFIITQTKFNAELQNAAFFEFATYMENTKGNKYSVIIQKALADADYDDDDDNYYDRDYYDDYDGDEHKTIDILDQWIDKAQKYVEQKLYDEAALISKAIIEEYSGWLNDDRNHRLGKFSPEYETVPFEILEETAKHSDEKELLSYCLSGIKNKRYAETGFYFSFELFIQNFAVKNDSDVFIKLLDELFADIEDKSSREAKNILDRKIDFYKRLGQEDKAWAVVEENIQIKSFHEEQLKKKLEEKNYTTAKKLINYAIEEEKKNPTRHIDSKWNEMLLDIAQKEKDLPAMRKLSYGFIENGFEKNYYEIYKASFSSDEWAKEGEKLFRHYNSEKYFNQSAADFLEAENNTEGLLNYVERYLSEYLSLDVLERYYRVFAHEHPEKTLKLFKKVLVPYAEKNIGRTPYERLFTMLKKMSRIKGGRDASLALIADFKLRYKTRKVLIEILDKF